MKNHIELKRIAEEFYKEYELLSEVQRSEVLEWLGNMNRHKEVEKDKLVELRKSGLNLKQKSAIKRKYEKIMHSLFVKECLSPDGYKNNRGEVFALLLPLEVPDSDQSDYVEYHISLITPAMAYTDFRYFEELDEQSENKPWWYKEYRPYFYDLSICVPISIFAEGRTYRHIIQNSLPQWHSFLPVATVKNVRRCTGAQRTDSKRLLSSTSRQIW